MASLIKLITNGSTICIRPEAVERLTLKERDRVIVISFMSGNAVNFQTPSPADAVAKLLELQACFDSAPGVVEVNDSNTGNEVTTTTTTCPVYDTSASYNASTNELFLTVLNCTATHVVVTDPNSQVVPDSSYTVNVVDSTLYLNQIPLDNKFGTWTLSLDGCFAQVNVVETTTTTTTTTIGPE